MKTKLILLFLIIIGLNSAVFAIDSSEYGSFLERSTIMNSLNKGNKLTQEQKDLLKQKKLSVTTSCLIQEIKKNNYENVSLLLEAKVNPNESYYTEYPIYTAAKYNRFDILKLLYEHGAKLDRGFFSELYEAVKNKNSDMAQYLINEGAKVNYQDSLTQSTILYYALKNNMIDIAEQLITKGAKLDTKSLILIKKKKLQELIENR